MACTYYSQTKHKKNKMKKSVYQMKNSMLQMAAKGAPMQKNYGKSSSEVKTNEDGSKSWTSKSGRKSKIINGMKYTEVTDNLLNPNKTKRKTYDSKTGKTTTVKTNIKTGNTTTKVRTKSNRKNNNLVERVQKKVS